MNIYDKILRMGSFDLSSESGLPCGGDVFYVDGNSGNKANTANSGQGDSWGLPFATVNYAISRCSNNAGNIIFVAADHTETIADTNDNNVSGTTTDEFCVDKAGVTIIGLGENTRRPTFTLASATDACIDVRAANVTLCNLIFYNTIADNVAMLDAQSTASGLTIENCKFYESAANAEAILQINLTANCDDVTIRGCRFYNVDTNDGGLASIKLEGGSDRIRIIDNIFDGDWNEQVIDADTAASTEVEIIGNVINNVDAGVASAIDLHSSSTGVVANNVIHNAAGGSGGGAISAAGCLLSGNRVSVNEGQNAEEFPGTVGGTKVGNHWYVDSGTGAATNSGTSWSDAVSTIDVAVGLATASNGDIIHVAPGHAETITGATVYILDIDKIGLTIRGEGSGDARPTLTFTTDATNACVDITAADTVIENIIFKCNMASQKYMIYCRTSADDTVIRNCEFLEGGQTPLSAILLGGGDGQADRVIIDNNRFYLPTAGNQDNAIEILFDMTGVEITNNYIMGNFDEAAIEIPVGGNASQDLVIKNNIVINEQSGVHCIEVEQTALTVTGVCANNILVNDTRGAALRPNILNCYGNVWMPLGGNVRPVLLEGDATTPGQNIYVNSAHAEAVDDTAHGTSWDFPLATIEYANTNCMTANNNDVIHVGPGHEETISDSVFLDFDTAGVTVIGYGTGDDRPMVTFDHANAVVDVGAAGVIIKNFIFRASTDAVAVGVDILDGFNDCQIINCKFGREDATDEFAISIQVGAASDYSIIDGCVFEAGAQAAVIGVKYNDASDHGILRNCQFSGAFSTCVVQGATNPITYFECYGNTMMTTGATDTFNLVAASTGLIHDNRIVMNAANAAAAMDIGNCWMMNNYLIADDDVGGAKAGLIDSGFGSVTVTADDA